MKPLITLSIALCLVYISCKKDTIDYPSLYVFSHVEQEEGQNYVIEADGSATPIATPPSLYVGIVDTLEEFVESTFREVVFFEEFELLSESELRFRLIADMEVLDTTVMYTLQDQQIVIAETDPEFIGYDEDADQIEVCSYMRIGVNGPNPIQFPIAYGIVIGSCEHDFDGHLQEISDQEIYVPGDTLGLYIMKLVYTK